MCNVKKKRSLCCHVLIPVFCCTFPYQRRYRSSTARGRQRFLAGRLGRSQDRLSPHVPCLCVLISDWKITGSLVCPLLTPRTEPTVKYEPEGPVFSLRLAGFLRFFGTDGSCRFDSQRVRTGVTAVGLCIYMKQPDLMGLSAASRPGSGHMIAAIHG